MFIRRHPSNGLEVNHKGQCGQSPVKHNQATKDAVVSDIWHHVSDVSHSTKAPESLIVPLKPLLCNIWTCDVIGDWQCSEISPWTVLHSGKLGNQTKNDWHSVNIKLIQTYTRLLFYQEKCSLSTDQCP